MKKRLLTATLFIAGAFAYVTLSSNSGGYGSNRTGSDGSTTVGCGGSGCHNSAPSTLTNGVTAAIYIDSNGVPVTKYKAGITYRVRLVGVNVGISPNAFGFQLSAVKGSGSTLANAGTFTGFPSSSALSTMGTLNVLGHTSPLSTTTVAGVKVDSVTTMWTAPATGSGVVSLFGVLNSVDGAGSADNGDRWDTVKTTLTEWATTTGIKEMATNNAFVYPNPVTGNMTISIAGLADDMYNIAAFDMTGKALLIEQTSFNGGSATLSVASLPAGMYTVVVEKNGTKHIASIVKQ